METVTIFKDCYETLQQNEFKYMTENARMRGAIIGLARSADNPEFVIEEIKKMAEKFEKQLISGQ